MSDESILLEEVLETIFERIESEKERRDITERLVEIFEDHGMDSLEGITIPVLQEVLDERNPPDESLDEDDWDG